MDLGKEQVCRKELGEMEWGEGSSLDILYDKRINKNPGEINELKAKCLRFSYQREAELLINHKRTHMC